MESMPKIWRKQSKPHLFCPGCGHGIVLKQLGFAIDDLKIANKTTFGIDIGCSLLAWNFFDLDTIQTHHGRTVPTMVGYKMVKPKRLALAYAGDGGAYAIGLQSLLHAAMRNDPITVIVVNNGNYAMTGGQMAPTTRSGDITSTTPEGKPEELGAGIKGPEMLANITNEKAYIARATVAKPLVLRSYLKNALENQRINNAFSFVEVLSVCPTNWKLGAKACFDRITDAESYFRLGEIKKGGKSGSN